MSNNVNLNKASSFSQCQAIAAFLESGKSITSLQALNLFGCMRLASRICDLRDKGYDIETQRIKLASGKFVTEYKLKK